MIPVFYIIYYLLNISLDISIFTDRPFSFHTSTGYGPCQPELLKEDSIESYRNPLVTPATNKSIWLLKFHYPLHPRRHPNPSPHPIAYMTFRHSRMTLPTSRRGSSGSRQSLTFGDCYLSLTEHLSVPRSRNPRNTQIGKNWIKRQELRFA